VKKAETCDLPRRLRLGVTQRERTGQRGQQEAAAVHPGMVGRFNR
jgi:hypothetical protein